jgi:hypothetical protein
MAEVRKERLSLTWESVFPVSPPFISLACFAISQISLVADGSFLFVSIFISFQVDTAQDNTTA